MHKDRLISLLTEAGISTRLDLEKALSDVRFVRLPPEQAVVKSGLVGERALYTLLADHYKLELASPNRASIDAEVLALIPADVAANYLVVPLQRKGDTITLAMADPLDIVAEDVVRHKTRCKVVRVLAAPSDILATLKPETSGKQDSASVSTLLNRLPNTDQIEVKGSFDDDDDEPGGGSEAETQPVIQLVNAMLIEAVNSGASDIHVEPQANNVRVRYRVDGLLRTAARLPKVLKNSVISRFKIISGMDISERRLPQDGRTRIRVKDRLVDARVNTLPSFYGEKVVLRILDKGKVLLDLEKLGFLDRDFAVFTELLESSQGMILITGPTGSGKTATLYSALSRLNGPEDNIITVEDPVEYQLEGITQVQVHNRAGRTFATALRAILRQDPDVVMLGEIRDLETAEIALQAAQTGHLVLSTLHTNDAPSTVTRLVQMGLARYLVASTLLCVVAQRLARRICPDCRVETDPAEAVAPFLSRLAGQPLPEKMYVGKGCTECAFTGYRGRLGLYEVLTMTDRLRDLVVTGQSTLELAKAAREEGARSMLADGLEKVGLGLTTVEEILRVVAVERSGGRVCPRCAELLADDFTLCPRCDEGLTSTCASCGRGTEPDWRTCPYCRKSLKTAEPPPLVARALPRQAPQAVAPERPRWRGDKSLILVVDDDEIQCEFVKAILERQGGYEVVLAHDGSAGLKKAFTHLPDLILSDVLMPEMSGFELVAALRERLTTALIPIIIMAGRPSPESELEGLNAGADDYIAKPIEPERLLARVSAVLRRSAADLAEQTV